MNIFLSVFILIISLGSLPVGQTGLSAQTFKVNFKGQPLANVNADANDTLKILAIMVNFQEDRDGATFGNGKFGSIYSVDYGLTILDPLPHDEQYFKDHLLFEVMLKLTSFFSMRFGISSHSSRVIFSKKK